jgi:hypothetical protein
MHRRLSFAAIVFPVGLIGSAVVQPAIASRATSFIIKVDDRKTPSVQIPWATLLMNDGSQVNEPCSDDGHHPEDRFSGDNLWICALDVPTTGEGQLTLLDGGPSSSRIIERRPVNLHSVGILRMTVRITDGVVLRKLPVRPGVLHTSVEAKLRPAGVTPAANAGSANDQYAASGDDKAAPGNPDGVLPQDSMVESATLFEETVEVDAVPWKQKWLIRLVALLVAGMAIARGVRAVGRRALDEIHQVTDLVERLAQGRPPAA